MQLSDQNCSGFITKIFVTKRCMKNNILYLWIMSKNMNALVRKHSTFNLILNLGISNRYLLLDSPDGWGICCLHVETSLCRPSRDNKKLRLDKKKKSCHAAESASIAHIAGELVNMFYALKDTQGTCQVCQLSRVEVIEFIIESGCLQRRN